MDEPIRHLLSIEGFDRSKIRDWVIGDKYVAVMNTTGNIGVCATLGTKVTDSLLNKGKPDPSRPDNRIILNAYYNSIFNYQRQYNDIADIFDRIDFSKHEKIVMVGYFETLYAKFSRSGIPLEVFDIQKESHVLSDIGKLEERLVAAATIILTGTTIFNNTFNNIVSGSPDRCNIFLLGPSNILSEELFKYRNIKVVFGSVFEKNDQNVMKKIAKGHGTKGFLPYLKKVYIINDNYNNEVF